MFFPIIFFQIHDKTKFSWSITIIFENKKVKKKFLKNNNLKNNRKKKAGTTETRAQRHTDLDFL